MNHKFRNPDSLVTIYHEDRRTFDPPDKFDYIFSSFADHHIKKEDKDKYFDNIKANLKPHGLLIVGDDFIREHDSNDREDRDSALRDYHNHIIQIAEQDGELILAELEREALKSGLEEKGDFKVSCQQYEEFLRQAGFEFLSYPIGPSDDLLRSRIGGVFVYKAWLRNSK